MSQELREICNGAEHFHPDLVGRIRQKLPYRTPKGFVSWETMSAIVALAIDTIQRAPDKATLMHSMLLQAWFDESRPLYVLRSQLLKDFLETDVSDLASMLAQEDWEPSQRLILVLPPQGTLKAPNGSYIPYFIAGYFDREASLAGLRAEHQKQIGVAALTSAGDSWYSGCELRKGRLLSSPTNIGSSPLEDGDSELLVMMRSLALQSLLAIDYLPDEVQESAVGSALAQLHTQRPSQRPPKFIYPRTLGQQKPKSVRGAPKGGHHRSPRGHWRKGHWRSQPCGKGHKDRRISWIRPTFING